MPGNDFVVSLGSWTSVSGHGVGNRDEQAGTLMHEFGHNLNLRHGGGDNDNYKPNYLSIMSYARQIDGWFVNGRPLDYSDRDLPDLDENNLSEPAGIGGAAGDETAFGPAPIQMDVNASGAINWNVDIDSTDTGVSRDINNFTGGGVSLDTLESYDDWDNIQYNFRASFDFADGIHLTAPESDDVDIVEVMAANDAPTADADGPYTTGEGDPLTVDASGSNDPDSLIASYEWDQYNEGLYDDATGVTTQMTYWEQGSYTVGLKVTDAFGASDTDTAEVTVFNVAPSVGPITVNLTLVPVGTPINASADFTDPGIADTHTAEWDWDVGSVVPDTSTGTVTQGAGNGSVADSHTYSAAGIYPIQLTVTDDDGGEGTAVYQYVVVYDPSAGFVTGGGWIYSDPGAYVPDPTLEGKANFGFVSKYKKGQSTPDGQTEFQFHVADLNFHSSSYNWLVVTSSNYAMFKGMGTINGEGVYKFRIWAGDDDPDAFRIKIWEEDEDGAETVIYDNGFDQTIGGGSIVIHTKK